MSVARRFVASRAVVAGAVGALVLVAIAVLAPWIAGDPLAQDLDRGLSAMGAPLPPSTDAVLGTDPLGRDVWARIAHGAGTSLWIAVLATAIAVVIGTTVGLVAGYAGGWIDAVLMRIVDLVMSFPVVLVAILLATLLRESSFQASTAPVILTLGVLTWTSLARVVRSRTMVIARGGHVAAALAIGAPPARILTRHVLPDVAGVVIAFATLGLAQNLLFESVLSFLGLGPAPPAPTWGRMVFEGAAYYRTSPHLLLAPGLAIVIAVVVFHLLGDGLRASLDARHRR